MNKFNWDDQENTDTFRDMPPEASGEQSQYTGSPGAGMGGNTMLGQNRQARADVPTTSEQMISEVSEAFDEEDEDYSAILSDARLRLEQGKLYEMVMNHELFDGMGIDERAVRHVQREIRRFAKERMEVMLGMRQEATKSEFVSSPFNDLEVNVLKKMAAVFSKGATESPEADQIAAAAPQPVKKTLTPIRTGASTPAPKPVTKLQSRPAAPLQRQVVKVDNETVVIPQEEDVPLDKHPSEMTEAELVERNRRAGERQSQRKAVPPAHERTPMPSYEQQEAYYAMQAMQSAPAVANVMRYINNSKKQ